MPARNDNKVTAERRTPKWSASHVTFGLRTGDVVIARRTATKIPRLHRRRFIDPCAASGERDDAQKCGMNLIRARHASGVEGTSSTRTRNQMTNPQEPLDHEFSVSDLTTSPTAGAASAARQLCPFCQMQLPEDRALHVRQPSTDVLAPPKRPRFAAGNGLPVRVGPGRSPSGDAPKPRPVRSAIALAQRSFATHLSVCHHTSFILRQFQSWRASFRRRRPCCASKVHPIDQAAASPDPSGFRSQPLPGLRCS